MDYVFKLDGDVAITTENAAGPWGPSQHGGAPSALITRVAEATPSLAPMRIARLTVDLMRPVPLAPLAIRTTGGRPPFTLLVDGRPMVRFGAQRQAIVHPDGPGFTTLSVVDGDGRSASVTARVE